MVKLKLQTERNIALKLYAYFNKEATRNRLFYSLSNPEKRTRHALGLSKSTLKRWIEGGPDAADEVRKPRAKKLDDFDKDVIRRVIHSMFDK